MQVHTPSVSMTNSEHTDLAALGQQRPRVKALLKLSTHMSTWSHKSARAHTCSEHADAAALGQQRSRAKVPVENEQEVGDDVVDDEADRHHARRGHNAREINGAGHERDERKNENDDGRD